MALPAPVDHRHRKAAIAQVAHGLEIFFDLLGAAGENADGALAARRRRPARKAQFGAVGRLDGARDDVLRSRVGWNRNERHGETAIGGKGWKSRGLAPGTRPDAGLLNAARTPPISPSCRPLPVFRNRDIRLHKT